MSICTITHSCLYMQPFSSIVGIQYFVSDSNDDDDEKTNIVEVQFFIAALWIRILIFY